MRSTILALVLIGVTAGHAALAQVTPLPPRPASPQGVVAQPERPRAGSVSPLDPHPSTPARVFAVGSATVFAGNVSAARQAALQGAYAEACARGAGVEIGRLTLVRNVRAVSDIVASRARGFVKSYELIGEKLVESEPPRYEVRISAVVEQSTAGSDDVDGLKLFLDVMGNPRLLVLVPETAFRAPPPEGQQDGGAAGWGQTPPLTAGGTMRSAEAAIAQAFGAFGYAVITSDDVLAEGGVTPPQLERARRGVTTDAVAVARAMGADLLLTGNVQSSWQRVRPEGVEFVSATTVASAKALVVSNGYVIEAFNRSTTKSHTTALGAITASLHGIAHDFATALAWKVPSILASRPRVTSVRFANVDLLLARKLKDAMAALEGVDAVRFAVVPTSTSPQAEFELLSGYILLPQDEIVTRCSQAAGRPVQLVSADRFSVRLSVM